ncbi:MAG: hypothetical protein LUQ38_04105 [Methanotrichaceae archaeon]|nr:hypothetical protein [Methanotrichaceae archaeon]
MSVIVLAALAMLCVPSFEQTTSGDWLYTGFFLSNPSKSGDGLKAFDKAGHRTKSRICRGMGGQRMDSRRSSKVQNFFQSFIKFLTHSTHSS